MFQLTPTSDRKKICHPPYIQHDTYHFLKPLTKSRGPKMNNSTLNKWFSNFSKGFTHLWDHTNGFFLDEREMGRDAILEGDL